MGEINFLSNGPKDTAPQKKSAQGTDSKWTEPNKDASEKTSGFFGFKKEAKKIGDASEKERIEKSREEVLEMIERNKKNAKGKNNNESSKTENKKVGSWISNLFNREAKIEKQIEKTGTANIVKETNDVLSSSKNIGEKTENNVMDKYAPPFKESTKEAVEVPVPPSLEKVDKIISSAPSELDAMSSKAKKSEEKPLIFNANTWSRSGVLETNLIDKSEASFLDSGKKIVVIFAGIFGAIFVVVSLYLGMLYYEHTKLVELQIKKATISEYEARVEVLEKEIVPAKEFQEKLNLVAKLLDKHIYLSKLFKLLEEKTLANVYYTSGVKVTPDDLISLSAETDDYESVKNQINVMLDDSRIKNVDLSSIEDFETVITPEVNETTIDPVTGLVLASTSTPAVIKKGVHFDLKLELIEDFFLKTNLATSSEEIINK